jgi:hypothetical protein
MYAEWQISLARRSGIECQTHSAQEIEGCSNARKLNCGVVGGVEIVTTPGLVEVKV